MSGDGRTGEADPEAAGEEKQEAAEPNFTAEEGEKVNEESGEPSQSTPNASRYPYPPEGYYPPGYPHPPGSGGGEGGTAAYPRGYEGGHGVPPYMAGYPPMPYPYHQPPMYPHYPGYPPPMYGYPPPGEAPPGYSREDQGAGAGPYHHPTSAQTGVADSVSQENGGDDEDGEKTGSEKKPSRDPAVGTAARLKTYIKPRIPSSQDVLDRRSRKNAQSRARAAKLRERIAVIEAKPEVERDEVEKQLFAQFENRRQRKNDRSRERALEKKEEIDRILSKPDKKRSKIEKQFLDGALSAKKRKNEGDRLRRQRLKEMGLSSKALGLKAGMANRGYGRGPPHPYGPGMGEMPMSPMPHMGGAHHPMQSPEGYGASPGSSGIAMGYPSPSHARRQEAPETPGRSGEASLPYIPGQQGYDAQSRVAQRRNPDGSMSISIGGETGVSENQEISDIPHDINEHEI